MESAYSHGVATQMTRFAAFVIGVENKLTTLQSFEQNSPGDWSVRLVHGGKTAGIRIVNFGVYRILHPLLKLNHRICIELGPAEGLLVVAFTQVLQALIKIAHKN